MILCGVNGVSWSSRVPMFRRNRSSAVQTFFSCADGTTEVAAVTRIANRVSLAARIRRYHTPAVPPPFTWIGPLFWIAFVWAFAGELPFMRREGLMTTAVADRGSKNLLLTTTAASVFFAFFIAATRRDFAIST